MIKPLLIIAAAGLALWLTFWTTGCLPYMGRCAGLSLLAALAGAAGGASIGFAVGITR